MPDVPWFYLGPLGKLAALPSPTPGLENSLKKVSAQHRSLNATTTEDVFGYRREWVLELPYLNADDVGYLEACHTGVIAGPLRLLDPIRRNRLSLAASATALTPTWPGGPDAATVTAGTLTTEASPTWPTVTYTEVDGRTVNYIGSAVYKWVVTESAALKLDNGPGVAVLPDETVTFSAYVQTLPGGSATIGLIPRTAAGDGTPVNGASATSGATWQRITVTLVITAGVISLVPRITATSGTVYVAAAQLERGTAATGWVPGSGTPEVLITDLPARSPIYPLMSAGLSLREV